MNTFKYLTGMLMCLLVVAGCKKEVYDDTSLVDTAVAPGKLAAFFTITQDNTGMVTITPNGEGAAMYEVYYGDATTGFVKVTPGASTDHKYAEGVYTVKLVAVGLTGLRTEATQQLTVSFRKPEDLEVTATIDPANNYKVNVSAKAKYETMFRVYFGDVPNEIPKTFLEGEIISHTYAAVGNYNVRVVALSGGAATTELTKVASIVDPVLLPMDFESPTVNYAFNNFDGGNTTIINNPQKNGLNTSNRVARMIKSPGQPWGGSVITLGAPINFSATKVFRMKVFSPRVGAKVLLKVENPANTTQFFEKEVAMKVANAWEDLVFDFNAVNTSNTYQNIVLIFDLGTPGDGSANFTFLFDDIRQTNTIPVQPGAAQINLPVTFDDPTVNYTVTDFGNNVTVDGIDPTNPANKIKVTTKPNGAETWAGTSIGTPAGFVNPISFTAASAKMSIRVYAPAAGIRVRLKVEVNNDPTKSVETEVLTTVANAWETLIFDFTKQATGTAALNLAYSYKLASVFFDFGSVGNGKVFRWDDVMMTTATPVVSGLSLPLDFEAAGTTYTFTNFDGGNTTVINNPQITAANNSAKVGRMVKGAGQVWGGSWIAMANPMNFATTKTFRMKVFSPRVGAKVLLKVENMTDGSISFEKEVATTTANAWENLTFDFGAINASRSYQKVVLIFDLGTPGDGSANFTYLFDDITLN